MKKVMRAALFCSLSVVAFATADLEERVSALESQADLLEMSSRLSIGGYGEMHVRSEQDGGDDYMDIHRAVVYLGYQFNDWIRLTTETELEHAQAGGSSAGYLLLEQFSVDLQLTDTFGVRLGRTLAPLGIVGLRHEPPLFFGVERPDLEKYILPSTWSIDGVGIFGDLTDNISYELYAVGGLDASDFTDSTGIRGGRESSYAGAESLSYAGRLDYFGVEGLRAGAGFYQGPTDHGSKGMDHANQGNEVSIFSADFEYEVGELTLNGVWASGAQSDVDVLPSGVGDAFGGYYLTAGYQVWSGAADTKWSEAALIPFVRFSTFDTQEGEISGGAADTDAHEREQLTLGLHMLLTEQVVLKLDYMSEERGDGTEKNDVVNLGFGFILQ